MGLLTSADGSFDTESAILKMCDISAAHFPVCSRGGLVRANGERVRVELAQGHRAIAYIAMAMTVLSAIGFALLQALDPITDLMFAVAVPAGVATGVILSIGQILKTDPAFKAALERARLAILCAILNALGGDGGITVQRPDRHTALPSRIRKQATADASTAQLLAALALWARRVLLATVHSTRTLRQPATA